MAESKDELFGFLGIDSKYEKELIYYRPLLTYLKDKSLLSPEISINQDIQRVEEFPVYQIIYDYQELLDELESMFKLIYQKEEYSLLKEIETYFADEEYEKIFEIENNRDEIGTSSYLEYFTTGLFIKNSISFRLDEVIDKYVSQYTDEREPDKIKAAEQTSVEEWKQLEQKSLTLEDDYENGRIEIEDNDTYEYENVIADLSNDLESLKDDKFSLHTTLADLGYIHRNRYFLMLQIIDGLYSLVESPMSGVAYEVEDLIYSLHAGKEGIPSIQAHMLIQFKQAKEEHRISKAQYSNYLSNKESLANDKQYFYQQVNNETKTDIVDFLYSTMEKDSNALTVFNELLVKSLVSADEEYNGTLAEVLNFYQEEATFYQEILLKIQNKEKIKAYYRICGDIRVIENLTVEWVNQYAESMNGLV